MGSVQAKSKKHVFKKLLIVSGILFLLFITTVLIILFPVLHVENFQSLNADKLSVQNQSVTALYDRDNELCESFKSPSVAFQDIPEHTKNAFIASEDKKFYSHSGVDLKRLMGAAWQDIKSGNAKEGGSTISQQVIKNTHLNSDKTVRRKLEEMKLAKELEDNYSKESILEIYLNRIYFGGNNYGIEAAAQNYFGIGAADLTLSQSAMLAGIIPSPNNYSPAVSIDKATARRDLVLKVMYNDGYIEKDCYDAALLEKIEIKKENRTLFSNNNYLNAALQNAALLTSIDIKEFGEKGYKIYTYLDKDIQAALENGLKSRDYPLNKDGNPPDSLGVVIDNASGGVSAYYGIGTHDLLNMKRSPASAIKPLLVYAPALDNNTISADGQIMDEITDFNGYSPKNYNNVYLGQTTIRNAVAKSSNAAAVKVLDYEGIEYAKTAARKAGIEFDEKDDTLALALGGFTYGVTPLSLSGGYAMLASGGLYKQPSFIRAVYGPSGNLIYSHKDEGTRAVGQDTAYIMTDILKSTVKSGTAKKMGGLSFEVAAKTGTAGNEGGNTDAYCMSYTSAHTLGLWLGAPDGVMPKTITGGGLPTMIAKDIYADIYKKEKPHDFVMPDSVTTVDGKLYATRFVPVAEVPAPELPIAFDNNADGNRAAQITEMTDKHKKDYDRIKAETDKKKENFVTRFWDKVKGLAG